ncbi:TetR/AcrR family transcriptional regulator [Nocardioides sp. NPDC051685]|uniref:TetR/AcrR family transcriptional regulator n=1 Tax=Nocardioides sp. NPDC051685 TaxID=3364334 RepID=UPI00379EEBC5
MSSAARRSRPGRPRRIPVVDQTLSPRDQILDVCARLFTQHGYVATSTRDIADAVGIRQASIYYHFAGKPGILEELLARTVRPTLDQLDKIGTVAQEHGAASALYALVMIDTGTLAEAPHNCGRLPQFPDVLSEEGSKPYKLIHRDLVNAYSRLAVQVAGHDVGGTLLAHLVEVVVTNRAEGLIVDEHDRHTIARTVLRACGATNDEIKIAAAVAWAELVVEPAV